MDQYLYFQAQTISKYWLYYSLFTFSGLSTFPAKTTTLLCLWTMEMKKVVSTVMLILGMKSVLDMKSAVAAAPSLPSSSTLRNTLCRTSDTRVEDSVRPEKSPPRFNPSSDKASTRSTWWETSNFGISSLIDSSSNFTPSPLNISACNTSCSNTSQSTSLSGMNTYIAISEDSSSQSLHVS